MKSQLDIRNIIAERLKIAREKAGFNSIEKFCQYNDIPLAQYQQHEEATLPMMASQAMRYCKALNISIYHLMIGCELEELKKDEPKPKKVSIAKKNRKK